MFGIGIPELILILIVGLIVFGPSKLPEIGRAVGKGLREFRKASSALQSAINAPDDPAPSRSPAPLHAGTSDARQEKEPAPAEASSVEPVSTEKKAASGEPVSTEKEMAQEVSAVPGYEPPTQESVRAQLEKQKKHA